MSETSEETQEAPEDADVAAAEPDAEVSDEINRLLIFGVIAAVIIIVPLLIVIWIAS